MPLARVTIDEMRLVQVAFRELRRLFGDYAYELHARGELDSDELRNFDALGWSKQEERAEVMLPSGEAVPFVALGDLERDQDDGVDVFYVHNRWTDQPEWVPAATAIGYDTLCKIHDSACDVLDAKGWDSDEDEGIHSTEFDPADIAAFNQADDEFGIGVALWLAIQDYPVKPNAHLFVWNDMTREPEVCLLTRRGRPVRVPVNDLATVHDIRGALYGRAWHAALQRNFVVPDIQTLMALRYLLELRSEAFLVQAYIDRGYAVPYRPASPAESAVSQDSAPGSPERASATFSTSPTTATSTTEYHNAAPAATGATTMDIGDFDDDPGLSYEGDVDLLGTSSVASVTREGLVDDSQAIQQRTAAHYT